MPSLGSYQSSFMAKLTFLQKVRELLNYTNVQDKVSIYWNFFNPSFLFLAGGSNLSLSTRIAGVSAPADERVPRRRVCTASSSIRARASWARSS